MSRRSAVSAILLLAVFVVGTATYVAPRLTQATPLANASLEPKSLSDILNFAKNSSLRETNLTPFSNDWENALATIQQYPGTASIYGEACSKYSCPGGIPLALTSTPQTLLPQKRVPIAGDLFGASVAMVGSDLLIGVPGNSTRGLRTAGAAYLYDAHGNLLATYHEPVPATFDSFGSSVAGVGGNILIGAYETNVTGHNFAGAVYLFDPNGNLLRTLHEPFPAKGDAFGFSIAGVGASILIGSPQTNVTGHSYAGAGYLFDTSGNLLATYHEPVPAANDEFGKSVAGVGGSILIGSPQTNVTGSVFAGAAYLFDTSSNLLATYFDPVPVIDDQFGWSVAGIGGSILISAPGTSVAGHVSAGSAYLFDSSGNLLATYHEPIPTQDDDFGISVASAGGGSILIDARGTTVRGFSGAGAAYLFDAGGNLLATFNPPTPAVQENFGSSITGEGGSVLIGSPYTPSGALGAAGAAYLFDESGGLLRTVQKAARPSFDLFGSSLAGIGSNLVVGAQGDNNSAGLVYVLDSSGAMIRTLQKPVPVANDNFGQSIAVLASTVFVGAPDDSSPINNAGAVYVYDNNGTLLQTLRNPGTNQNDYFGYSLTTVAGDILVGAPGDGAPPNPGSAGAAFLFDSKGALLATFYEPIRGVADHFGISVASVGANILIGSPGTTVNGSASAGAAYLFDTSGNLLASYHEPISSTNDKFGWSVAGAGSNLLVSSPNTNVTGHSKSGAAYLFNSSGGLLFTLHEPTVGTGDGFGYSVAAFGGSLLIGSPGTPVGGFSVAGAAYLYDSNANLLKTLHEPNPGSGNDFGLSVASAGSNIIVGSPFTPANGTPSYAGAVYLYRQFGLRDSCAAASGSDCLVVNTTGSYQAGSSSAAVNSVTVSLRSARNATLGTQMALTVMCNSLVPTASIACSALYVDGNAWGPQRDPLTKSPFVIVNAEPYFYLTFHWYDPNNQRIFSWSYWWYGTNVNPNWYWEIYLSWRSYVSANIGVWTPYWWYFWYWVYFQYWNFWTISVAP